MLEEDEQTSHHVVRKTTVGRSQERRKPCLSSLVRSTTLSPKWYSDSAPPVSLAPLAKVASAASTEEDESFSLEDQLSEKMEDASAAQVATQEQEESVGHRSP